MADELAVAARLRARPAARLRPRRLLPRAVDQAAGEGGRHRRGVGRGHRGAARGRARAMGLDLVLDEGGGAFYGPKISVQARDAIGRTWQMSTIQVDFQHAAALRAWSTSAPTASAHRPIMIHRALFGSVERFFGVLARALRRRVPGVAGAGAGAGAAGARRPRRLRRAAGRPAAGRGLPGRRGRGRREARQPHPQGQGREAARTCWWSATTTSSTARSGVNPAGRRGRARRPGRRLRRAPRAPRSSPRVTTAEARGRCRSTTCGPAGAATYIDRRHRRPDAPSGADDGRAVAVRADPRRGLPDERDATSCARGAALLRPPQRLPVHERPPAWCCRNRAVGRPRGPRPPTSTPSCGPRSRDAVAAVKAAYRPDGVNVGAQPRRGRRGRRARPPPRPLPAPLGRRHQLHDVGGRDPRAARAAGRDLARSCRAAWPRRAEARRYRWPTTMTPTSDDAELDDAEVRDALPDDLDVVRLRRALRVPQQQPPPDPGRTSTWSSAVGCIAALGRRPGRRRRARQRGLPVRPASPWSLVGALPLPRRAATSTSTSATPWWPPPAPVGFPVGHASAQMGWRGLRSRPTWRILLLLGRGPARRSAAWCWSTASTARSSTSSSRTTPRTGPTCSSEPVIRTSSGGLDIRQRKPLSFGVQPWR